MQAKCYFSMCTNPGLLSVLIISRNFKLEFYSPSHVYELKSLLIKYALRNYIKHLTFINSRTCHLPVNTKFQDSSERFNFFASSSYFFLN